MSAASEANECRSVWGDTSSGISSFKKLSAVSAFETAGGFRVGRISGSS
jgi:hypothetical protein